MLLDPADARPGAACAGAARAARRRPRASSSSCRPRSWRSSRARRATVAGGDRRSSPTRARELLAGAHGLVRAGGRRRAPVRRASRARSTRAARYDAIRGRVRPRRPAPARVRRCRCTSPCGGAERALAVYNALRALPARAGGAGRQRARSTTGADTRPRVGAAASSRSCCRARACRRRFASWEELARSCAGARRRRVAGAGAVVVGAAPAPDARRRSSCACPTRRRRSPTPPRWPPSSHALVAWLAERHDAGEPLPRRRPGGSRRTAGRRAATASRASWRTSRAASAADPRAPARAARHARAASPSGSAAPRELAARPGARGAQRRRAPARSAAAEVAARAALGAVARRALRRRASALGARGRGSRAPCPSLPRPARRAERRRCSTALRRAASRALGAVERRRRRRRPAGRRRPAARAVPLLRAALPRAAGRRRRAGSGSPGLLAAPRARSRRASRRRCCASRARRRAAPTPAGDGPRAARDRRRRRRPVAVAPTSSATATLEQVARVRRPPLGLPAQGGRPALVGASRACSGPPKAALVEIQADEYGGGRAGAHPRARCSPTRWRRSGSTPRYGAYLDRVPGVTLATVNLMSLFGLHRRWRGAIVGHLALFEMTSSIPNRRYANGLRRLGFGERRDRRSSTSTSRPTPCTRTSPPWTSPAAWRARSRSSGGTCSGARAALAALEARWARHLLDAWDAWRGAARRARCRDPTRAADGALKRDELVGAVAERPDPRASRSGRARSSPAPRRSRRRAGPAAATGRGRSAGRRGRG